MRRIFLLASAIQLGVLTPLLAQHFLKYDSLNEPKAKGLHFSIEYPNSWKSEAGDRPNIVQKFVSDHGRGMEVVTILAKDVPLPPGQRIMDSDLDELYSVDVLERFIPKGGTALKYAETKIDGERTGCIYYLAPFERANIQLITKAESYIIFRKGKMLMFTFQAMRLKDEGAGPILARQYELVRPTFLRMASSIVLLDKWK